MELNQSGQPMDVANVSPVHGSSMSQSSSTHIISRHENITKSPNDKRSYRGLILNNQLKVILISDPTTEKSAASMDVSVGYFSDPDDIPGLAHFCEHMLFLGTKEYPEINDYNSFLSQNGGSSNAATYSDHTNYFFDVSSEKLEPALDRFAQFFISPLFSESMTERELNAVHSEHMKNKTNDTWRLNMLEKSSADSNHPFSKFSTGNKDTLETYPKMNEIDVRQALLDFHEKWYSSNLMALSVLGSESLDKLEEIVVQRFSGIKNKSAELLVWDDHPFKESDFMHKWYIVPIKDIRNLNVGFPIPYLLKHYKSSPVHYIAHLIGHEGEGSLLSALREKGWCNSLLCAERMPARGFAMLYVSVDLTEEGINHVDDIVHMIFSYIRLLKKEKPLKWIFEEYKSVAEMNFRFKEKVLARNHVMSTVLSLQEFPMEDVLTAPSLFTEWKPEIISEVLTWLTPEKVRIQVIGQAFENIATESEKWYGTKYCKKPIPLETIEKWKNAELNPALRLPAKNDFIATDFSIKLNSKETIDKYPVIIEDTPLMRIWYKQDSEFLVPRATLTLDFISSLTVLDPLSTSMTHMFVQLLRDSLNECAYNADLAGLKWSLNSGKYGVTLTIGGYDHKQHVLLETIMDRMVNFTVDPKRFEILKDNYIRGLKNFETEQPYQHAIYHLIVLLSEKMWDKHDLLAASSDLSASRLQRFIPQLLSKMHVECLFYGNITKTEALNYAKLVETKLTNSVADITPLLPSQLLNKRAIEIRHGNNFLYEIENKLQKNSCVLVYYQVGLQSTETNTFVGLFVQIVSEPIMTVLRTQEQLGYIVTIGVRKFQGIAGIHIIVQSEYHPQYVEQRVNNFMKVMLNNIEQMSEEEFQRHKESMSRHLLDKPKKLATMSDLFWAEIATQQYNFDRPNVENVFLSTVKKEDLVKFCKELIDSRSTQRHKLSVHVISTHDDLANVKPDKVEEESVNDETDKPIKITDMLQFKASQCLYPLPKPFINVPRKGAQQQSKL